MVIRLCSLLSLEAEQMVESSRFCLCGEKRRRKKLPWREYSSHRGQRLKWELSGTRSVFLLFFLLWRWGEAWCASRKSGSVQVCFSTHPAYSSEMWKCQTWKLCHVLGRFPNSFSCFGNRRDTEMKAADWMPNAMNLFLSWEKIKRMMKKFSPLSEKWMVEMSNLFLCIYFGY